MRLALESTVAKPDPDNAGRYVVYLGHDEWPFPVPLVKEGSQWRFDTKAGLQEIEDLTIGRNEIGAIAGCRAYVIAQIEYASEDPSGEEPSPLGPFVADSAALENAGNEQPAPFFGYYFRILTAQGANATGGARDFLIDGHLLGGFALVAWPAEYGVTGVKTFIVNQLRQVYEKDLGDRTGELVKVITRFDPDKIWDTVQ